jgi:oligogalacturonide lyase
LLLAGIAASRLRADTKAAALPSEAQRYPDPATEFEVIRLTDPTYTSILPAYYNRAFTRNGVYLFYASDHSGSPQVFRMDLKTGAARQVSEVEELDPASITLTPDNRAICYFAGRALYLMNASAFHERKLYDVPDGWDRCPGMSVGPDGTHAMFGERRGDGSRLRMVTLAQGAAHTVMEAPFVISDPVSRPMRAQALYRKGAESLWLVNFDGKQNRQLKLADGGVGPALWAPDGRTIFYLNFPEDTRQLNTLRESTPDANIDKNIAKTSQFSHFGVNHDGSVFVGASRNIASPHLLLLLKTTRRELTICEHKASCVEMTAPRFSPDNTHVYFQSDRHGKPAIYSIHVDKLVEKSEAAP